MVAELVADTVLVLHLLFILFVLLGALLVVRWPRVAWLHLPAVLWGVVIEFAGFICPLTPLENRLRLMAGKAGYSGGFIEHYLVPIIYPANLDRSTQWALGVIVILLNLALYGLVIARFRNRKYRRQSD